jgi:S-adenosyl methyltransferase
MPSGENEFWRQAERDLTGPVDATVPHSARVWNFWLGGKDWYEADQVAAAGCSALFPAMAGTAGRLRAYTSAAVRFLAGQAGVRQFLDIGAGLPFDGPVHQVAQRAAPGCRVVYADNDPLVVAFGRALLTSRPPGSSGCIDADLNDPAGLLSAAGMAGLDFTRPVAVLLMSVLGHIGDPARDDDRAARSVVAGLRSALPPGSWLAVGDLADMNPGLQAAMASYNATTGADPYRLRSPARLARFLDGLDLAGPALAPGWNCGPGLPPCPAWGVLGRKP